ncbi:hypothetical protein LEMLEM_LOCUS19693, partial [Lemmus lemmus]
MTGEPSDKKGIFTPTSDELPPKGSQPEEERRVLKNLACLHVCTRGFPHL